jgi:hypothetical protein
MKSIFGVYESILTKTSSKVKQAASDITVDLANGDNSDLRKFFNQPEWSHTHMPFSIVDNTFVVTPYNNIYFRNTDVKLADLIGRKFDKVRINGTIYIGPNVNVGESLYPVMEADVFSISNDCIIDGVELHAISYDKNNRRFPMIYLNGQTVTDSRLEIDQTHTNVGHIRSIGIPTFKNVVSDSIRDIGISNTFAGKLKDDNTIFLDDRWKNLFEFGYTLGVTTLGVENKSKKVKVKDMMDIRKLVAGRQFYSKVYDQAPYRLKPGAKMTDFLDVSGFKDIKLVLVEDDKLSVYFENIKNTPVSNAPRLLMDVLRENPDQNAVGFTKNDILDNIPVTDDGWRVIVMKR